MKKLYFLAISVFAFAGCTSIDFDEDAVRHASEQEIKANVESVFGTKFSPNQDWTMTSTGTVKITADADFNDIVEVQVLSESPYLNSNAMVLNQAPASKGETVELAFEAPKGLTRLIAACVNSQGEYYITGFDVNATQVNFASASKARTRTETNVGYPSPEDLQMNYANSFPSFNAVRTQKANDGNTNAKISKFKNSNWENDRLWRVSDKNIDNNNGWKIDNGTIVREIDAIDETEKQTLNTIFQDEMGGFQTGNIKYNNIEAVRNTKLFEKNNYITSDGKPLILTPVSMNSFELNFVYYYYFDPTVLENKSEAEKVNYIKSLPKFKAINCDYTREEANNRGFVKKDGKNHYMGFFKLHEYLLPYYGDPSQFINIQDHEVATTDGTIYRFKHGQAENNGTIYYLTYTTSKEPTDKMSDKLAVRYEDDAKNIENQLWQIFTMPDGKGKILYNIGSQRWIIPNEEGCYTILSNDPKSLNNNKNILSIEDHGTYYQFETGYGYLGSDVTAKNSKRVAPDKDSELGERIRWYPEVYNASIPDGAKENIELDAKNFIKNAEGIVIPAGYQIGFLHRKVDKNDPNSLNNIDSNSLKENTGETYGDGRLNKEINTFPNFNKSIDEFGMRETDPRIAIFKANGKKYMTFEEGVDCNYTDMVIEISSGMEEEIEPLANTVKGTVYTFCFEDTELGDYDMNDVIIKAMRMDKNHVLFSLEACGAHDELFINGINGQTLNENAEVHALFGVDDLSFINTQGGGKRDPIQEIVKVDEKYSFSNTKDQIYIYNKTKGYDIKLSTKGQDPHGIVIPFDFEYPIERICIGNSHTKFSNWGEGDNTYYNWYMLIDDKTKVFSNAKFVILDKTKEKYPEYFGK